MFEGYLGRDEATAAVLRANWYHTGDIARLDAEGYLYLVDRKKEMVISGGQNIYPLEIERLLADHPEIKEATVLGIEDRVWGEILVAAVVPVPGASLTPENVISYCGSRLAGFKKPKLVRFLPSLPRDSGGKVQRRQLRSLFTDSTTSSQPDRMKP
jgi:fatty-acyl-CoA synthase